MERQTNLNGNNRMQSLEQLVVDRHNWEQLSRLTAEQLAHMRPTLLIFLGGSGQLMATSLKALLLLRFGDEWRRKIRLLAFDTAEEPLVVPAGDLMVRLEVGSEFHHIGEVPIPNIRRNVANLESIQERLGTVLPKLPAGAMRGDGAKCIRPLALMAFYWHFETIYQRVRQAIWGLAGRNLNTPEVARQQQGINVFIGFSIAGATGSGTFLDMANLVRHLANELGEQGQFCHITGVCILPQAFQSIPATNLYTNSAASLEELDYLMVHGGFKARYPGNRLVHVQEAPFNLIYVLDGLDEQGQTWSGIQDVTRMAAEGILLQMVSQLGRKGDNAFDNVDEILIGRTPEGQGTFLASYGLGYLEFPAPAVADLCTRWLLAEQIRRHWLAATVDEAAARQTASRRLQALASGQLNAALLQQAEGGAELRLDLRQPAWLATKPPDRVAAEAVSYVREYGLARVNEGLLPQIHQNAVTAVTGQKQNWTAWVNGQLFSTDMALPQLAVVLQQAQRELESWLSGNQAALAEVEKSLTHTTTGVNQAEAALREAGDSFFVKRAARVGEALDRYFKVAQELYAAQFRQELLRGQRRVWSELVEHLANLERSVQMLRGRLENVRQQMSNSAEELLAQVQKGGVARQSLADEGYVRHLYQAHAPEQVNLLALLDSGEESSRAPLSLAQLETSQLADLLQKALAPLFAPVHSLDIERVITDRSSEMTARARRQQLLLLATPSWSIDRARLPEGGANLSRIEIMGVPNAADTIFAEEGTLVSTYDPYRLVALVVVAGAPPSALQQYEQYQLSLDQVRHFRPMHILPQFMADANQARLAFGLGHIFEFIFNQGAYFYYQPADDLASPIRLGNGLANAIQRLESDEELTREVMERADSRIARLGLQQAIATLTAYYENAPEGRTPLDELVRELKRLVRDYADELHQIDVLNTGTRRS